MTTTSLRVRPKDAHYRIEDPATNLCIRLDAVPAEAADAPKIVPRLTDGGTATWFPSWALAAQAFARYLPGQAFNIVRVDG